MMGFSTSPIFFLLTLALLRVGTRPCSGQPLTVAGENGVSCRDNLETYIIHVRKPHGIAEFASPAKRLEWHRSFLPPASPSDECKKPRMIYSYEAAISGFAAMLTPEQLKAVKGMEGFVHAHQEQVLSVQTTHTPEFLGLRRCQGLWQQTELGKGVIIGVLDTGIHPDHPSFKDDGLLPPPPTGKWRGHCGFSDPRLCNNKLIGAVSFAPSDEKDRSPFDINGHGTHVAGTAAGMFADGAQLLGMAPGTAAGIAPYAHLAVYKVCGNDGQCREVDILAGIDQAIHDGVDVMSVSLGGHGNLHFYDSTIAIGSLAAIERGIFVSCAGNNDGPYYVTVGNDAPWILTVGASTMDRATRATLRLANGREIHGETIYQPSGFDPCQPHLLAYPGASGVPAMAFCEEGSLDGIDVRGKFVMCLLGGGVSSFDKGQVVRRAGGAAVVLMNGIADGFTVQAELVAIPAIRVSYADSQAIWQYFLSQLAPQATLEFHGTTFGEPNSPVVASFSSRGPSWANNGDVLKPDVLGPGVDILAAWPFHIWPGPSDPYNIISGTSMATPHLSGVAALLKSAHSDWSPAAIRSAIMTTSDVTNRARGPIADQTGNPADVFAMGAGHVNPPRAAEPGLVYDLDCGDYLSYLCSLGYTQAQVEAVARRPVDCSRPVSGDQLNYPSLSTVMGPQQERVLTRTLTNVGEEDKAIYRVEVEEPEGVTVRVAPERLVFSAWARKLSFEVTLITGEPTTEFSSGVLRWFSNNHVVASPIVVLFRGVRAGVLLSPSNITIEGLEFGAKIGDRETGKGGAQKLEGKADAR